ncbi:MAG TPA: hypothetical protein VGQ47_00560, partial [Candidatus Limnocylindrales bacterium]|nr:hypothetical protein [Candidatus Limnocylindrales bacterium]
GREAPANEALLGELAELRELERRRRVEHPAPEVDQVADDEIDRRTRRLMDRFRDLAGHDPG